MVKLMNTNKTPCKVKNAYIKTRFGHEFLLNAIDLSSHKAGNAAKGQRAAWDNGKGGDTRRSGAAAWEGDWVK